MLIFPQSAALGGVALADAFIGVIALPIGVIVVVQFISTVPGIGVQVRVGLSTGLEAWAPIPGGAPVLPPLGPVLEALLPEVLAL